jgi:hypothetical protein
MIRYYQRVTNAQIRHAKGIKAGSGSGKPKKYDKAHLSCSVKGCDNDFLVSMASTPSKRWCAEHYDKPDTTDKAEKQATLAFVLNLLKPQSTSVLAK